MSSIRPRPRANGTTGYVLQWREEGRQHTRTFDDGTLARRYQRILDNAGSAEMERLLGIEEATGDEITLTEWCELHIDTLTGVQKGTTDKYRAYVKNDIAPVIGELPLSSVTEHSIARWVQSLEGSGKTIQNKHAFLSGALGAAVRAKRIPSNPCEGRRLPRTNKVEMVFLSPDEFGTLLHYMPERWRPLTDFLISTGMRFGEATALQVGDIDLDLKTARITRAWKYSGKYDRPIGTPKSRKGTRTINLPDRAIKAMGDLSGRELDEYIFTNTVGNPVRSQLYGNTGWIPAVKKATAKDADPRLPRKPRIHDLRHSCASWMLNAGVPIIVVSNHLGHEDIRTTVNLYGHLDRAAAAASAAAIDAAFTKQAG